MANIDAKWSTLVHRINLSMFDDFLLDRDAFREVSGLVYVAAATDSDVVGEELEGDNFEDGKKKLRGLGYADGVLD